MKEFTVKELIIINLLIVGALAGGFTAGFNIGQLTNVEVIYENPFTNISWYPENVSEYNFEAMRDLFTPMYNDTVTVEQGGYINGSWWFWVNHTKILSSYFFENLRSYKVAIPLSDKIYLLN